MDRDLSHEEKVKVEPKMQKCWGANRISEECLP